MFIVFKCDVCEKVFIGLCFCVLVFTGVSVCVVYWSVYRRVCLRVKFKCLQVCVCVFVWCV